MAIVTALLASLVVTTGWSAPGAAARVTSPATRLPVTQVDRVRPTDRHGHKASGYHVTRTFHRVDCEPSSEVVRGAFRCFTNRYVIDPCWLENTRHLQALCLLRPWSHKLIRLHISQFGGYPPYHGGHYAWGITLRNGYHCVALQGAHGVFHGRVIDYSCGHNVYVLRGLHRQHRVWRADTVVHHRQPSHYTRGPSRNSARAFVGLKSWQPGHD